MRFTRTSRPRANATSALASASRSLTPSINVHCKRTDRGHRAIAARSSLSGHFRATGKTQTTFGIECTIDSVARQMGLSPYELRLQNVLRDEGLLEPLP